jgi:rhodanese-related sulfurtransferase
MIPLRAGYVGLMTRSVDTEEVRRLLAAGAQLVDVLPAETFRQEHLPGAVNVPLAEIDTAPERLDPVRPVIAYCYDYQCDLSPRAACRLEQLGFSDVYDYTASKVAWLAEGGAGEGLLHDSDRAGAVLHRDVPRVALKATIGDLAAIAGDWELGVVVGDADVVVGVVRREALGIAAEVSVESVMQTGPATVRPSISIRELAKSMDDDGQQHVLVTKLGGELIGLVRRGDLDGA